MSRPGTRQRRVVRPEPGARQRSPLWWVVPLVLAVLLALGAWVAYGSGWWVVREVRVQVDAPQSTAPWAEEVASAQEVQRASGLRSGDRVVDLPRERAQRSVEELPGVDSAEVGRGLTGTVRITVHLEEAVARTSSGGDQVVLDADGREIARLSGDGGEDAAALPEVVPAPGVPAGERAEALARSLPTLHLLSGETRDQVREYRVAPEGLSTVLHDSYLVRWGHVTDAADLATREKAVRALLAEQPPAPGATLDATAAGSVVVTE
ncbi:MULTISPECIES: cell division protein FtsQ/DivIB [Kytococcus]|uniref:cell division protein FtsQ/DivIB n=1 Tax=Kytococcus TaxID=57499 RepID=UPI0009F424E6|nr:MULTISPECIES: FtsQ-type POTRA domain-containing protein [Kytococcus]